MSNWALAGIIIAAAIITPIAATIMVGIIGLIDKIDHEDDNEL